MLFKPDEKGKKAKAKRRSGVGRRLVSTTITLLIICGLFYIGWNALQQKQGPGGNRSGGGRPDLPVPVLAATPSIKDIPVYLDGVGSVRALNTVTVRSQVDGKLIAVNFVEGQDVKKGDVLAEIDPAIYQAQYDRRSPRRHRTRRCSPTRSSICSAMSSSRRPVPARSSRPIRSAQRSPSSRR